MNTAEKREMRRTEPKKVAVIAVREEKKIY